MSTLSLNEEKYTQYGTIQTSTNGYSSSFNNNGCVKCKLEQVARRWSQGDLAISDARLVPKEDSNGWTSWGNDMVVPRTDFTPEVRPCRGKYYLLRHGSSFYLLQFPCCRTR